MLRSLTALLLCLLVPAVSFAAEPIPHLIPQQTSAPASPQTTSPAAQSATPAPTAPVATPAATQPAAGMPAAPASGPGNSYKVVYDGGSLIGVKAGDKAGLEITANGIIMHGAKDAVLVNIPASSVTEISYGQDVHRRVGAAIGLAVISFGIGALMALSKSKKHFIGLTYADGDKKGGFAMQCDKNEYRGILAALEGITGKKSIDSDQMNVKN